MNIRFGESVRALRRAKGLTQEQMAAQLNVSFQTISKWERDESWPDLSMLPVLARFFGVSMDTLLRVDEEENERRIRALLEEMEASHGWETFEERNAWLAQQEAELEKAVGRNPQDWRLWYNLLCIKLNGNWTPDIDDPEDDIVPEGRVIYEKIMQGCPDEGIRIKALNTMIGCLNRWTMRDSENQREHDRLLEQLPALQHTRSYVAMLNNAGREGHARDCQAFVAQLVVLLCQAVWNNDDYGLPPRVISDRLLDGRTYIRRERAEDVARAFTFMAALFDLVYPDGDYGEAAGLLRNVYEVLAKYRAALGPAHWGGAFEALNRAAGLALEIETTQNGTHTSFLVRGLKYERGADPRREHWHESWPEYPWPEGFKEDPRFAEVLAALTG